MEKVEKTRKEKKTLFFFPKENNFPLICFF